MHDQLDSITEVLLSNGYRLTEARRAIVKSLLTSNGHLSADELVDVVRQEAPRVGRMTVYRTLELLTDLSLIRPVYQGSAAAQYILLEEGHHHHIVCSGCNDVIEFDHCSFLEIEESIRIKYGFHVKGHLLEIYGQCQKCHDSTLSS